MELPFHKGINKIIEEYCYYPRKFDKELLVKTYEILDDTERYWTYSRYFVNINPRYICKDWGSLYSSRNNKWTIGMEAI